MHLVRDMIKKGNIGVRRAKFRSSISVFKIPLNMFVRRPITRLARQRIYFQRFKIFGPSTMLCILR